MRKPSRPRRGRPPRSDALHRRIAETLRRRIRDGGWALGAVIPSFLALAQEFRTGEGAVRLALQALKSEGWIAANARRRLVAAKPSGSATTTQGLVLQVVGLPLQAVLGSPVSCELQRGIALGVGDLNAPLLVAHGTHLEDALPDDLLGLPLRGIAVLWPAQHVLFPRYEKLNVPVVLIDKPDTRWHLHTALVDNAAAAGEATRRLIALGHRAIAFLGYMHLWKSEVDPDSQERRAGFIQAVKEAGLWRKSGCVFHASDFSTTQSPPLQALVKSSPPFTAVLVCDPNRALLVLKSAQEAGLEVPRDLSVACFQGKLPTVPRLGGPRVDFMELARKGVHLLEGPRTPARHVREPAVWTDGQTVAPPRRRGG